MAVFNQGFQVAPGGAAPIGGVRVAPLSFVDGASLNPDNGIQGYTQGAMAGVNSIAGGIKVLGTDIGEGMQKREDNRIKEKQAAAELALTSARLGLEGERFNATLAQQGETNDIARQRLRIASENAGSKGNAFNDEFDDGGTGEESDASATRPATRAPVARTGGGGSSRSMSATGKNIVDISTSDLPNNPGGNNMPAATDAPWDMNKFPPAVVPDQSAPSGLPSMDQNFIKNAPVQGEFVTPSITNPLAGAQPAIPFSDNLTGVNPSDAVVNMPPDSSKATPSADAKTVDVNGVKVPTFPVNKYLRAAVVYEDDNSKTIAVIRKGSDEVHYQTIDKNKGGSGRSGNLDVPPGMRIKSLKWDAKGNPDPTYEPLSGNYTDAQIHNLNTLRDDFRKDMEKENSTMIEYPTVRDQLKVANGTSDIAAINALQRMIDPGVAVREGDVTLIQQAIPRLQRMGLKAKNWIEGDQLTPEVRELMMKTAKAQVQSRIPSAQKKVEMYKKRAVKFGLDFEDFANELMMPEDLATDAQKKDATGAIDKQLGGIKSELEKLSKSGKKAGDADYDALLKSYRETVRKKNQ